MFELSFAAFWHLPFVVVCWFLAKSYDNFLFALSTCSSILQSSITFSLAGLAPSNVSFLHQLDVLCHRVLTTLADSKPGKEYEDRAYNTSLLLRKLACQHPMLLLRYVG